MISTYNQLCPVLFGPGASAQLADKVKEFGGTKALCIYDKGVEMTGTADKLVTLLKDSGIGTVVFDGVQPDAPADVVNRAGQLARDEKVDVIVGIGGGSSLDTAKATAVLAENPLPITQYLQSGGKPYKSTMPLILIPTASGTGSEVTIMAVVHNEANHTKEGILRAANLAIVDPELTLTVPPFITAATGFDALSHAVESLSTNCGNPKAEVLSLAATKLIAENLEKAYLDGGNLEARTNLSFASNIAGMAFTEASLHIGHAAAHEFGVRFHMQHGVACALTLPEVVTFAADIVPEKTKKIAEALGVKLPENVGGAEAGELAAEKIRDLLRRMNIPSLKAQGISREDAVSCAHGAVVKNWFATACALKPVNDEVMAEQIGKMYDNYQ
jgi:alcohol dehydrogenase class IV